MAIAAQFSNDVIFPSFSLLGKKAVRDRRLARHRSRLRADAGRRRRRRRDRRRARRGSTAPRTSARRSESWAAGPRPTRSTSARAATWRRCARASPSDFDSIDILVNNAGVTRDGLFRKMDRGAVGRGDQHQPEQRLRHHPALHRPMAARGWGRVINISSIVGRIGNFGQANYAAAKAGLIGLTKTLAREYARKGVTVNAIAPGFVKTRMLEGVPDKAMQSVLDTTPVGRLGDPMEIARERPLPGLAGRRLRHRPRARRQRRHGDVAHGAAQTRDAHDGDGGARPNRGPARALARTSRRCWLEQQRTAASRLCVCRVSSSRAAHARRHDRPHDVVLEERDASAAALPPRDAGDARRAGAALLRAGQPALHPRPAAGQERRPAVPGPRVRGLHDRLGRPVATPIAS